MQVSSGSTQQYAQLVLDQYRRFQAEHPPEVGYMLPEREFIGQCLQKYVDETAEQRTDQGSVLVNPLSTTGRVVQFYV